MKKILVMAVVCLFMAACGNKSSENTAGSSTVETKASDVQVYKLDDLLAVADEMVDQKVKVRGFVTHTCKHAGKRCFIVGESQKTSFRVEAGGEIGGFNRELIGSELEIEGIVKERRLSQEYLSNYEKELQEKKAKEDGSAETCEAELSNIEGMRQWMKEHGKDYYAIYYMDGENFEVVEEV